MATNLISQVAISLQVQTAGGVHNVQLTPGRPVFVLGRNGTGKSALVHRFVGQLPRATYIPGSRPNYFDNESLSMTPASRRSFEEHSLGLDRQPQMRYRPMHGTQRNEKAVHDLQAAEMQFKVDAANDIKSLGVSSPAIQRLQSESSPLDRVNEILLQSNIPVSLVITAGELRAQKGSQPYSIARMSDGERAALIIAAEIIASPSGTVFIIDEPELHLHRSIVVPLLETLLAERPDCFFVVSTHELELPAANPNGLAILTRGCVWQGDHAAAWDVDVVSLGDAIPENTRIDMLGSRRKVLFVEGENSSLDSPMYSILFPAASVRSRRTARDVKQTVQALRAVSALHHTEAFGIIDNDALNITQCAELRNNYIFPLSVTTVESLYYCQEILMSIADQQASTFGDQASSLLTAALASAIASLDAGKRRHLAARVAELKLRDAIYQAMPNRDDLNEAETDINVTVTSPFQQELAKIDALHASNDIHSIIRFYPIRYSQVLNVLASGLKFRNKADYEKAALKRLMAEPTLRSSLISKFGDLAPLLR